MTLINKNALRGTITGLCATLFMAGVSAPAMASSLQDAVAAAELHLGGEAFEAERYWEDGSKFIDVELLSGNQIVEAVFLAEGSQLIDVEIYSNKRRVNRATRALKRADISLSEAIRIAEDAVGAGEVREAELQIRRQAKRSGKRFLVEVRDDRKWLDVLVNSRNGKVLRVRKD